MDLEAKVANLHKRLSVIENERGTLTVWPGEVRDVVHLGMRINNTGEDSSEVGIPKPTPAPHPLAGLEFYCNGWDKCEHYSKWDGSYEHNDYRGYKFRNAHTQQPITREQFVQALRNSEEREAKAITAPNAAAMDNPLYRVGDLVEVVDAEPVWPFKRGERFHIVKIIDECCLDRYTHGLPFEQVRLISRP